MKSGTVTMSGSSHNLTSETDSSSTIFVTPNGANSNVIAWVSFTTHWIIHVSDASYIGDVDYTII